MCHCRLLSRSDPVQLCLKAESQAERDTQVTAHMCSKRARQEWHKHCIIHPFFAQVFETQAGGPSRIPVAYFQDSAVLVSRSDVLEIMQTSGATS